MRLKKAVIFFLLFLLLFYPEITKANGTSPCETTPIDTGCGSQGCPSDKQGYWVLTSNCPFDDYPGCYCDKSCGAECESSSDCPDHCSGGTRYYNGSCTSGCDCSYITENCNAWDWCYSYGTGCEDQDWFCTENAVVKCDYNYSNRYTDTACSYSGCSADKCTKTGTFKNYDCYGTGSCNFLTDSCSDDCASGQVCSGGTCSSGSCASTDYFCDDQGACDGHKTTYTCDGSGSCTGVNSDDDSACNGLSCGQNCNPLCPTECCTKYCDGSGNCGTCTPPSCPPPPPDCFTDADCPACNTCSGGSCVSQGSPADGNKCNDDCTECSNGSCVNRLAGATAECGTCDACNVAGGDCVGITALDGKNCNGDCTRCVSGSCDNRSKCASNECSGQERCDAAGGSCRDPDANSTVCTDCYSATWDSVTSECCGDDGVSDNWCNSGGGSCVDGTWYGGHCSDGIQNCDEADIDCGGGDCSACGTPSCDLNKTGNYTISLECILEVGSTHTFQNGNLTVATGGSIIMNSNSSLILQNTNLIFIGDGYFQMNQDSYTSFSPGFEIKFEGTGYITQSAVGAKIQKITPAEGPYLYLDDTFNSDTSGWSFWESGGCTGYNLSWGSVYGYSNGGNLISGDDYSCSAGMKKTVDISGWSGTMYLEWYYRATSGYANSSVTNFQLCIPNSTYSTNCAGAWEDSVNRCVYYCDGSCGIAGGVLDTGWVYKGPIDISSAVSGRSSITACTRMRDSWGSNWNQRNYFDNFKLYTE